MIMIFTDASTSYPTSKPKAAEAEDVLSNAPSRQRRTAILTPQSSPPSNSNVPLVVVVSPTSPPTSAVLHNAEQDASSSDLIAIRSLPGLPSPKYTEFPEDVYAGAGGRRGFPEDVDCDEDEEGQRVSPPPMYAPSLEGSGQAENKDQQQQQQQQSFRGGEVKGLGLDTKGASAYWPLASDGIYVV